MMQLTNNHLGDTTEIFGSKALDAFRSALYDDDFEPLSLIFPSPQMMLIKDSVITYKKTLTMPSEDDSEKCLT